MSTTQTAPTVAWDGWSDQQKVEWLATNVMSWKVLEQPEGWTDHALVEQADGHVTQHWNPLTDWNHWRQVEEKVFNDEKLVAALNTVIGNYASDRWMRSDLPTRARALYLAYQSLR